MTEPAPRGSLRQRALRWLGVVTAALVAYYAMPEGRLGSAASTALSAACLLLGMAVVTWLAAGQIRRQIAAGGDEQVRVDSLLMLIGLAILLFAAGYFGLERAGDEFAGLETKTDAIYFTVTTLATVGFGDVHATGQLARALVTLQIIFNLVVIAALASTISGRLRRRAEDRRRDAG